MEEGKEKRILGEAEGERFPGARNNPITRGQPGSIQPASSPVSQPTSGWVSLLLIDTSETGVIGGQSSPFPPPRPQVHCGAGSEGGVVSQWFVARHQRRRTGDAGAGGMGGVSTIVQF